MIAKRSLLSSLCLTFPLLAFTANAGSNQDTGAKGGTQAGGAMMTLDELREKCNEYANNSQLKEFSMKLECSGKYTYFIEEKRTFTLDEGSRLDVQTTTKDGLYQTEEKVFTRALDPYQSSCSIWSKKQMAAPSGMGIPASIAECSQLTAEYVQNRCAEEIKDYCEDNMIQGQQGGKEESSVSSSDQNGASGMCVLSTVEVIDTCALYTQSKGAQAPSETQTSSGDQAAGNQDAPVAK